MVKRKDGRWQEQITVVEKGRKVRKYFYGRTKKDVLLKIAAYKERQEAGALFGDVAAEWWEQHESTLGPITGKSYIPALKRAEAHFGATPISRIKPTDIHVFLRDIIAEKKMAQKTARTQLMVINLVFKYAVQSGYIEINPARDLEIPKGLQKTPRLLPSDDDIARIKRSTDCQMGMFALWVMYTGCRKSELLALTWEDVDVRARTITISKSRYQVNNKTYIKEPKTEAGYRVLPLLTKLYERVTPGKGLIFPAADGDMMTERRFELDWNKYRRDAGISCTPHQLRHCYATMLYEEGISVKDAQELLGHAQASTTQDIYTHIREQRKEKIRAGLLDADIR